MLVKRPAQAWRLLNEGLAVGGDRHAQWLEPRANDDRPVVDILFDGEMLRRREGRRRRDQPTLQWARLLLLMLVLVLLFLLPLLLLFLRAQGKFATRLLVRRLRELHLMPAVKS